MQTVVCHTIAKIEAWSEKAQEIFKIKNSRGSVLQYVTNIAMYNDKFTFLVILLLLNTVQETP
jgi:hypothetical protein